jgi:hypothetical protein
MQVSITRKSTRELSRSEKHTKFKLFLTAHIEIVCAMSAAGYTITRDERGFLCIDTPMHAAQPHATPVKSTKINICAAYNPHKIGSVGNV